MVSKPCQGCEHCPDGHADPTTRPWAVWVAGARDGDGQPMYLIVCPTNGAHVAESDAEWLRELVNDGLGAIQHQRIARLHKRTAEQLAADLERCREEAGHAP